MSETFRALEWEPIASCPEGVAVEVWVERVDGGYPLPFPAAWRPNRDEEGEMIGRWWQNVEGPQPITLSVKPSYWRRWPEQVSAIFLRPDPRMHPESRA